MSDSVLPPLFAPMMAYTARDPFDSPDHWFDVKWDGVRVIAYCEPGRTRLYSRTQREVTHQYPELANLHERLRVTDAVIDGEIVATEPDGRPSFQLLQQRISVNKPGDVRKVMAEVAVQMMCFDLVFAAGEWIGSLPLVERYDRLAGALAYEGRVLRHDPIENDGIAFFNAAAERGLEGTVAKRKSSRYQPGRRSRDWLKIKVVRQIDCVIGGYSPGRGGRAGTFGALLIGVYDAGALRYIGSVGTGFDDRMLAGLRKTLEQIEIPAKPFADAVTPPVPGVRWVRPQLVCMVEYRELTKDFRLRGPSFKALRTDKMPEECQVEDQLPGGGP